MSTKSTLALMAASAAIGAASVGGPVVLSQDNTPAHQYHSTAKVHDVAANDTGAVLVDSGHVIETITRDVTVNKTLARQSITTYAGKGYGNQAVTFTRIFLKRKDAKR